MRWKREGEEKSCAYGLNCDSDSECLRTFTGFHLVGKRISPALLLW